MRRTIIAATVASLALALGTAGGVGAESDRNFIAPLDGNEEVPAVETRATGVAKFKVAPDGASIGFKLNVANIHDVFAAHIHCAPAGENGPVGVTLFSGAADGRVSGTLHQGSITAPDGANACGWDGLADVAAALQSGGIYVNVHTASVPSGEIRGQVR